MISSVGTYSSIIWEPQDIIEVRCIHTSKKIRHIFTTGADIEALWSKLNKGNSTGWNIFAGVLPRTHNAGTKDVDVDIGRCVWCDFDDISDLGKSKERAAFLPKPSMIINSGHGHHFFWRLDEAVEAQEVCKLVGDMADVLPSDTSVKNSSRILRLPGFTNHKPPVAQSEIVESNENRYEFRLLRDLVDERMEEVKPEPEPVVVMLERKDLRGIDAYMAKVDGSTTGGRTHCAYRAAAILSNDFGLSDAESLDKLKTWDMEKNNPPIQFDDDYPADELSRILKNANKYHKQASGSKVKQVVEIRPTTDAGITEQILTEIRKEKTGSNEVHLSFNRLEKITRLLMPGSTTIVSGMPGTAKSMFCLSLGLDVSKAGHNWKYLPLENTRIFHVRRLAAIMADTFSIIDRDSFSADEAAEATRKIKAPLDYESRNILDNPMIVDGEVKPVDHRAVINWIEQAVEENRLVIVDPFANIAFDERNEFQEHTDFIRRVQAISMRSKSTVVIVIHSVKRPEDVLILADIEGSKRIGQLADCCIMIKSMQPKEIEVAKYGGIRETVEANRMLNVVKARNGKGDGAQLAYSFGICGSPRFIEHGVKA